MITQMYLTFIQIADSGSFTKAAQQLFISPVSVMKQINNLENQLDVKLFNRSHQGVTLTPAGQALYTSTTDIVTAAATAIAHAQTVSQHHQQIIRVGASIMRPGAPLVALWRRFADELSDYQLAIVPINDDEVSLQSPTTQLGTTLDCVAGPTDAAQWYENYQVLPLGMDAYRLAVPQTHRLADHNRLTWTDLRGETIVLPPRNASPTIEKICRDLEAHHPDIHIHNTTQFYNTETFNAYANSDQLLITRDSWQNIHPLLKTIPVDWDYESAYGLIFAKQPSAKLAQFITIIKKLIQKK